MRSRIILVTCAIVGALAVVAIQRYSAAERGQRRFAELGCSGCHFSGGGPNLTKVVRKHNDALLERFILDPQSVYRERNMKTLNSSYSFMPRVVASRDDVRDIIAYFHALDEQ
jgi:nitrous-oxide reductase